MKKNRAGPQLRRGDPCEKKVRRMTVALSIGSCHALCRKAGAAQEEIGPETETMPHMDLDDGPHGESRLRGTLRRTGGKRGSDWEARTQPDRDALSYQWC